MGYFRRLIGVESDGATLAGAAEANGFEVVDSDADSCAVVIEALGYRVLVAIFIDDDRDVAFTFFSSIQFPPDRLPEPICKVLDGFNQKESRFAYGPFHGKTHSKFVVRTFIPRQQFSKESMFATVRDALPRVTALDEILQKNGYAR